MRASRHTKLSQLTQPADSPQCPSGAADDDLAALDSSDTSVVHQALARIAKHKDPGSIQALLRRLPTADAEQAQSLAHTIATIGGDEAWRGLRRLIDEARSTAAREAALYGLVWLLEPRSMATLLGLFEDLSESCEIRCQAAEGMIYLVGEPEHDDPLRAAAVAAFLASLTDLYADVRYWSVVGLGVLGVSEALPKLREMAAEDDGANPAMNWSVRQEANEAIAAIISRQAASPVERRAA